MCSFWSHWEEILSNHWAGYIVTVNSIIIIVIVIIIMIKEKKKMEANVCVLVYEYRFINGIGKTYINCISWKINIILFYIDRCFDWLSFRFVFCVFSFFFCHIFNSQKIFQFEPKKKQIEKYYCRVIFSIIKLHSCISYTQQINITNIEC